MQTKNNAATELDHYFAEPSNYAHASNLVLENYGAGYAWLRPSSDAAEPDDALYVVTDLGRRELALEALFGHPWPSVAEACHS